MISKFHAALIAAVALVFGFFGGGAFAAHEMPQHDVAADVDHAAVLAAHGGYNPDDPAVLKQAVAQQREQIEVCVDQIKNLREEKMKIATVIYEPTAGMTIPVLHGLAAIPIGNNGSAAPKWIVPGKVVPQIVGTRGEAFQYKYLDLQTQKLDGPYLALQAR